MKKFHFNFLLISVLIILQTCQTHGQNNSNGESLSITRRSLLGAAYQSDKYYIIYCSNTTENEEKIAAALEKLKSNSDRQNIIIKNEKEINEEVLQNYPLLLVGEHYQHKCLQKLAPQLHINLKKQSFEFAGRLFRDSSSVLMISYFPNPLNKRLPVSIITANSTPALLEALQHKNDDYAFSKWGYEVFNGGKRVLMGNFTEAGSGNWKISKTAFFEFKTSAEKTVENTNFQFFSHIEEREIGKEEQAREYIKNASAAFFALFGNTPNKIKYEFFKDGEQKGLMTGNTAPCHIDINYKIAFSVLSEDQLGYKEHPEVALLAKEYLGESVSTVLEKGLPIYFSKKWNNEGYLYWFSKLVNSKNNFSIKNIMDDASFQNPSDLVKKCIGAGFTQFIIEHYGIEVFKQLYKGEIDEQTYTSWENDWNIFKESVIASYSKKTNSKSIAQDFYWKGFNFTHEGYQIYNGYLSKHAANSLDTLKKIGANSISIVPYSYMRNPEKPTPFPIPNSAGSENDAAVIHSIYQAKARNFKILLKPQVWVGRNSWPGDVGMKNEADWLEFFEHYYQWIRHYALMAEIHEVDALCLGVEFSKATLKHTEKWREIIEEIRKIYSGKITYSANWGEEFEKLQFWDALDYVGISCYYPLSKEDTPNDKALKRGFERVLNKLEKVSKTYSKPVLLTEIGFRSITAPWKQPYDYPDEQNADELGQQRCYEVVFNCLKDENWCKGMFWWKWPTTFEKSNNTDKRFIPYNKAAEKTVRKWYKNP
ncbi:MAG: hypothetical protein AAGI07_16750 [Bacteroidota bacterium]